MAAPSLGEPPWEDHPPLRLNYLISWRENRSSRQPQTYAVNLRLD